MHSPEQGCGLVQRRAMRGGRDGIPPATPAATTSHPSTTSAMPPPPTPPQGGAVPLLLTIPPAGQLPSPLPSLLPTCFFFYVDMLSLPCGHAMIAL